MAYERQFPRCSITVRLPKSGYSVKSKSKQSLACHFRYDNYDVPDTMNVHGIYDTSATMHTFESRGEFQSYLQKEAGVSGSYFGFYAGAKKAWGSSVSAAQQQYMSVLDVDVDR